MTHARTTAGASVEPAVPPYFDGLIEGFRQGRGGRFVHLGHWDEPPSPSTLSRPGEFERAQARLNERLLALAALDDGLTVLDVGCGFGGTLDAINRTHHRMRLAGVNVDRRQLGICLGIAARNGNALHWETADAAALPFAEGTCDRVLCIEAMFHFRSRAAFFREAARVLAPGGILVASDIVIITPAARFGAAAAGIETAIKAGFGPWPDFWGREADHRALGDAAGLRCTGLVDATAHTLPSHAYTSPSSAPASDPGARAATTLRALHREGHLKYLYLRFDKRL
jgi:MPBQ/MSBQ methyltransferase